jgi:hypothetical protein
VARFEKTRLRAAAGDAAGDREREGGAGRTRPAARSPAASPRPTCAPFVMCDRIHVDGEALVSGLVDAPGPSWCRAGSRATATASTAPVRRPAARAHGVCAVGLYATQCASRRSDHEVLRDRTGDARGATCCRRDQRRRRRHALPDAAQDEVAALLAAPRCTGRSRRFNLRE